MAITSIIRNLSPKVAKSFLNKKFLTRELKPTEKINIDVTNLHTCIEKITYATPDIDTAQVLSTKGVLAAKNKEYDVMYNEIHYPNYIGLYSIHPKEEFVFNRKFLKNNKVVKYVHEARHVNGSYSDSEATKNGKTITEYIKAKESVNGKVTEKIVKTYFADKDFSLVTELYDKNKKLLETHTRILEDSNHDYWHENVTFIVSKPNKIESKIETASFAKYKFGSLTDFSNFYTEGI